MKKTISIFFLIACLSIMFIIFIPKEVEATIEGFEEITSGDYKYRELLDDNYKETGYIVLSGYTGVEEKVVIPSTIDGKIVLETTAYTFYSNATIKSVTLPKTLKKMFAYTFYDCCNLENINIPNTVEFIDEYFLRKCSKANYTIPKHLEKLGKKLNVAYIDVSNVTITGTYCYDLANEVIKLVNEERAKQGMYQYTVDEELMQFAKIRSSEISIAMVHERPSGLSTQSLLENQYQPCNENIGGGQKSPQEIVQQWLDSQFHHPTLMSNTYQSCGVGCYMADDGTLYWVFAASEKTPVELTTKYTGREENIETNIKISKYHNFANLEIIGIEEKNELKVGESISPTDVRNINIGWKNFSTRIKKTEVNWKSSDENVFTVDKEGNVTAVGVGNASLTAQLGNSVLTYMINVKDDKYQLGDVNEDGKINTVDAIRVLQHISKKITLTDTQKLTADTSQDGKISTIDVIKILQYISKKITKF